MPKSWRRAMTFWMSLSVLALGPQPGRAEEPQPQSHRAAPDLVLLTDAPGDDPVVVSLQTLYPRRLVLAPLSGQVKWPEHRGVIAFSRDPRATIDSQAIDTFVEQGGAAVLDLSLYARARGLEVQEHRMPREEAEMRFAAAHPAARGYAVGDAIPWYAGDADAVTQRALAGDLPAKVIGEAGGGTALLTVEQRGAGAILATDLAGLPEPTFNQPGSFNKYLFLGNLLGDSVRYGRHFPERYAYADFVSLMRRIAERHPAITLREEGPAWGEDKIYSFSLGDPDKPAFLVYAATHGVEWEPAYGLLALAERLAERPDEGLFDFQRFRLVLVPIVNPSGYERMQRPNANAVDLNRNAGLRWEAYRGRANADGVYGPGSYDWKGDAAFSEAETQTFRAMVERIKPRAALDLHGNAGGHGYNRLVSLPSMVSSDRQFENETYARDAIRRFNEAMADRYVLREARRPGVEQYQIDSVQGGGRVPKPTLMSYVGQEAMGFLVELPAQYRGTYGMVFQTDVTIETCLAFFRAYELPAVEYTKIAPVELDAASLRPRATAPRGGLHPSFAFDHAHVRGREGPARFLVHAAEGDEVAVRVRYTRVGSYSGDTLAVAITGPAGEEVQRHEAAFEADTDIVFHAPDTGLYAITSKPGQNATTIVGSSHPINLNVDGGLELHRGAGDYYFWVPAGCTRFALRVSGKGMIEGLTATLSDASGNREQAWRDLVAVRQMEVQLDEPSRGEAWRLRIEPPSSGMHYGGQFIELLGVPPVLAPSRDALLMPRDK